VVAVAVGIVISVTLGGTGRAARGDDTADARKHAQRASSLAASGKCRQAVAEFDKALAVLRDPALLFNRGECHRKLGDADAAIEDYKQFLSDLPKAPNRAEVERRIAELTKKSKASSAEPTASVAPVAVPGEPLVRAPASTPKRENGEPRAPGSNAGPAVTRPAPPPEPEPAKREGVREVDLTAPPPAPATAAGTAEGTTLSSTGEARSEAAAEGGGLAAKPWFWVAIAAVAVGAGVGAFFLLSHDDTKIPSSALGNYQF
jgi:tetratricopeptide (TPR) repeat protein